MEGQIEHQNTQTSSYNRSTQATKQPVVKVQMRNNTYDYQKYLVHREIVEVSKHQTCIYIMNLKFPVKEKKNLRALENRNSSKTSIT